MKRVRPTRDLVRSPVPGAATAGDARAWDPRLQRVRRLAWLLDRSIPLGGKLRIGLDPLIGLLPGGGDVIGVGIALFIVWEGARLGLPTSVVTRMLGNVVLEGVVGTVPLLGDLFDAAWQANMRNVRLIEQHYQPDRPERPLGRIALVIVLVGLLLLALILTLAVWLVSALWNWLA